MANRFHGSYRTTHFKSREHGPRGVARAIKQLKRAEAEQRSAAAIEAHELNTKTILTMADPGIRLLTDVFVVR